MDAMLNAQIADINVSPGQVVSTKTVSQNAVLASMLRLLNWFKLMLSLMLEVLELLQLKKDFLLSM